MRKFKKNLNFFLKGLSSSTSSQTNGSPKSPPPNSSANSNALKRSFSEKSPIETGNSSLIQSPSFNSAINFIKNLSNSKNGDSGMNNRRNSYVIMEYLDSENEHDDDDNDQDGFEADSSKSNIHSNANSKDDLNLSANSGRNAFKTADMDLALRPPIVDNLSSKHNGDFVKSVDNGNEHEQDNDEQ
jgi:hypothetical protein